MISDQLNKMGIALKFHQANAKNCIHGAHTVPSFTLSASF